MSLAENLEALRNSLPGKVTLVAVSKTHPPEKVLALYDAGQRDFGENKVQELLSKQDQLPKDIRWHLIGHLQTNKVKSIVPFVYLIHSVDSLKLLREIDKYGAKAGKKVNCLLQVHIAREETKFGLSMGEILDVLNSKEYRQMRHVHIRGLMGMATNTENEAQVRSEFRGLKQFFDELKQKFFPADEAFHILSMGMSGDYKIAMEEGSNMVRIGSALFGERAYNNG